jgi:uncharacterized membrane protein
VTTSPAHLAWSGQPLLVALAVVATLAAVLLAARGRGRRAPELILLAVGGALLTLLAARPEWVEEGERTEEGRLVVLVDRSRSMSVLEADGRTRLEHALELVDRLPGAEVYGFDGALAPGRPAAPDGNDTDLGAAVAAIQERYAGEKLAGIAVLSDGLDRGGLRRKVLGDPGSTLPTLGGPLTVYQVGGNGSRDDVSITDLRGSSFAFLRSELLLEADVAAVGVHAASVPVVLERDGQPVARTTVAIGPEGRATARFSVRPEQAGRFIYEVSVPPAAGDVLPANNRMTLAVRVVRDRMRVLQVCGSPGPDQKFLRLLLKEDPGIDLVSFFILRTMQDMGAGYSAEEISLIEFPYKRLFSEDLSTFDLVILQNFDYAPYFEYGADELLGNLAQYVQDGGAIAMLGGDRSFDLGGWANTAVGEILPVKLGATGDAVDLHAFRPTLTEAGARHPVSSLVGVPSENASIWAGLAPFDGINLSTGPATGGVVLLEHPTLRDGAGRPVPVLAVAERGKGRTLALMGDSSWRWSFDEAGAGRGNQAYLTFWKNAMRWLVKDPEDERVAVETARENWRPGEEVALRATVRDAGFGPLAGARVVGTVRGPGGSVPIEGVTGGDGAVSFRVPATERGSFRVKLTATAADGIRVGEADAVWAVVTRDPEMEAIEPSTAFLQAFAARAGGAFVGPDAWQAPTTDPDAGRRVRDRRVTPLYAHPLLPALVGLSTSASWWLRRRKGLR